MTKYQQHPLSAAFPRMKPGPFADLRAHIAAHGLINPIILFEDQVLDGWHRSLACEETGAELRYATYEGTAAEAVDFVVGQNTLHRQLTPGERVLVAGRLAVLAQGRPNKEANLPLLPTVAQAAETMGVSERTVKDARVVLKDGTPEEIAQVESGEVAVSKAAKNIRKSKPKKTKPAPSTPKRKRASVAIGPRTVTEWTALELSVQQAHLAHRDPKAKLNRQKDGEDGNLIDWAKWTWNPITGCNHNCPYCYARDIAERFDGTPAFPNGFTPTLRADRLSAPLNVRPHVSDDPRERRIFTGSMTDLFGRWVPEEWINAVLSVAKSASVWDFLMLTKFPKRMAEFVIPANVWMGTSVDCQARVAAAEEAFQRVDAKVKWLSCEPMIEPLRFRHLDRFNLIVIGGATASSETPRWIPPFAWLDDLMRQADDAGCAVFLKSNLYRKEQPGGSRYVFSDRAPKVFHYLTNGDNRRSAPGEILEAAAA